MRLHPPLAIALAFAAMLAPSSAFAQVQVTVPPTPGFGQNPPEDIRLARSMADEVRRLADDIATDLGQTREGRHASEDARELAQSIDEYRQNRRAGSDPIAVRQAYSGLHANWQHLRAGFRRTGASTPVIDRDLARIDALDDQLAKTLGLNALPPDYYRPQPNPPEGLHSTRWLARALVDRAEGLVVAVQDELGRDPRATGLVADVRALALQVDAWHDSLDRGTPPEVAARSFGPVDTLAVRVERTVTNRPVPPRVANAWAAYAAADEVVHRNLNIRSPHTPPNVAVPGITIPVTLPAPPPRPPLAPLADALVNQTSAFLQVFGPTAGNVPEGRQMLNDAERLLAASQAFRENVARRADPNTIAASFRDVDAIWSRLARRVNRIAKGRIGPNINQVAKIGGTCDAIHRHLGMPGVVPMVVVQ